MRFSARVNVKHSEGVNAVTRQQAHALLHSLVKKGLLEKFGKTKTSYYKLATQKASDV
jgi:Fic family protein